MYKKTKIFVSTALLIVAAILFYQYAKQIYPVTTVQYFSNPENLAEYLRSFGAMTVVVSLALMVVQTLFTPLPLFLLAGANGFIFGVIQGTIITLAGSMLGASIAFYLARGFARGIIYRHLTETYKDKVEKMSHREGPWMVFMARLIPIIPSSIISYIAGLSKMGYRGFFFASVFGKLPEIIIYTALGHSFSMAEGMATKVTVILILLTILAWPLLSRKLKVTDDPIDPKNNGSPPHDTPPGE